MGRGSDYRYNIDMQKKSSSKKWAAKRGSGFFLGLLVVLLGLLVACGSAATNGGDPGNDDVQRTLRIITSTPLNTSTPTVTPTPIVPVLPDETLAGVALELWYVWTPAVEDPLAEVVAWFNAENAYGIRVTTRAFSLPSEFEAAMQQAVLTGNGPQLVLAYPYQYQPWVEAGAVVDLTPYLESAAYGMSTSTLADFYPVFLERDAYAGERWGFPGLFSASVMLYNQSWGRELGYANPPETAAAFRQQSCTASEESGGLEGGYMSVPASGSAAAWLLSYAGHLVEDGRYLFDSAPVEQAFTFLAGLKEDGCAWTPAARYPDADFFARRGLFYPVTTVDLPYIQANYQASESSDDWTVIGYPNDAGEPVISVAGRLYVVMQTTTEEQIAAWLLVRELVGERSQVYLAQTQAYLPLDTNTAERIETEGGLPDQWFEVVAMLDQAVNEPRLASWDVIRTVTQDAVGGVLSESFEPGQLSLFLKDLNDMIAELSAPAE